MIDLNKPIRNKYTGNIVDAKELQMFDVEGSYLEREEFLKRYENLPEKEYTFEEVVRFLKDNSDKIFHKINRAYCVTLDGQKLRYCDEFGNTSAFDQWTMIDDVLGKWVEVK
jgi:hypothetical protein